MYYLLKSEPPDRIVSFLRGVAGGEAAFLALDPSLQQADRAAWTRAYLAVDRAEYPHIWQIRDDLAAVTDDEIFETMLAVAITGLRDLAPRPCGCQKHAAAGPAGPKVPAQAQPALPADLQEAP